MSEPSGTPPREQAASDQSDQSDQAARGRAAREVAVQEQGVREVAVQEQAVHEPPFATSHIPKAGGAIGNRPEDFRVDEIPAYVPTGEGEHCYVRVEKRGLGTPELVQLLAREASVNPRDIGYAGLKDRRAVTTQWLSLPKAAAPVDSWKLPADVRVLETSRHANKLRTGHLRGNHFRIELVGLSAEGIENARAIAQTLERTGFPNYFGGQRFGREGSNLGRALAWLRGGGRARLSAFLYKLYPSVVQAEVFNRYLTLRRNEGLERVLAGEVMRLGNSGSHFLAEDEATESARLARRETALSGPIVGPKMRPAGGTPLALEERAVRDLGLGPAELEVLARAAPGTRRDLVVFPESLLLEELGEGRIALDFSLPSGSYATVLVREFTRSGLLLGDAPAEE